MERIYKMALKVHKKCKLRVRTVFFFCTVIGSFILGMLIMTAAAALTGNLIAESFQHILIGALYIAVGIGFFGGIIYLMRK